MSSNTPIFDEVAEQHPGWIKIKINKNENTIFKVMTRVSKAMNLTFSKDKLGLGSKS